MFHICNYSYHKFQLVNGVMSLEPRIGPGTISTDLGMKYMRIWLDRVNHGLYSYQISVNAGDPGTPTGIYYFWDETGDYYSLQAFLPYTHTVQYNSAKPSIVRMAVTVLLGETLPEGWDNAPQDCPRSA